MRLLLDTTYLLPAIGVGVRPVSRTVANDLHERGHDTSICSITIFELAAKGARLIRERKLSEDQVREGILAILTDGVINQVPFEDEGILARAIAIRAKVNDFIDCLILGAAAATADALVSEDKELQQLVSQESVKAKLNPVNADFTVYSFRKVP